MQINIESESEEQVFLPKNRRVPNRITRALAAYIINTFSGHSYSVSKYRKHNVLDYRWTKGEQEKRGTVRFNDVVSHLHSTRDFDHTIFSMPPLRSNLLDAGIGVGPPSFVGSNHKTVKFHIPTSLGKSFPLSPMLDRQGVVASDMQNIVEKSIWRLFWEVVNQSNTSQNSDGPWLTSFRMLLNEACSAVDLLLNKITTVQNSAQPS